MCTRPSRVPTPGSVDPDRAPYAAVIQELMQTDLHRVIRTQQLTDDHCQVRLSPSNTHRRRLTDRAPIRSTSYTRRCAR